VHKSWPRLAVPQRNRPSAMSSISLRRPLEDRRTVLSHLGCHVIARMSVATNPTPVLARLHTSGKTARTLGVLSEIAGDLPIGLAHLYTCTLAIRITRA
jgi:hypothetical protein